MIVSTYEALYLEVYVQTCTTQIRQAELTNRRSLNKVGNFVCGRLMRSRSKRAFDDIFIRRVLPNRNDTRVITRALGELGYRIIGNVFMLKLVTIERLDEKCRNSYQRSLSFPIDSI